MQKCVERFLELIFESKVAFLNMLGTFHNDATDNFERYKTLKCVNKCCEKICFKLALKLL